jgi:hypothetical protein
MIFVPSRGAVSIGCHSQTDQLTRSSLFPFRSNRLPLPFGQRRRLERPHLAPTLPECIVSASLRPAPHARQGGISAEFFVEPMLARLVVRHSRLAVAACPRKTAERSDLGSSAGNPCLARNATKRLVEHFCTTPVARISRFHIQNWIALILDLVDGIHYRTFCRAKNPKPAAHSNARSWVLVESLDQCIERFWPSALPINLPFGESGSYKRRFLRCCWY